MLLPARGDFFAQPLSLIAIESSFVHDVAVQSDWRSEAACAEAEFYIYSHGVNTWVSGDNAAHARSDMEIKNYPEETQETARAVGHRAASPIWWAYAVELSAPDAATTPPTCPKSPWAVRADPLQPSGLSVPSYTNIRYMPCSFHTWRQHVMF